MSRITKIITFCTIILISNSVFAENWYQSYGKALRAIKQQQWQVALHLLDASIKDRSQAKANAKTYGLRFIDYLPYLYRGVANYHLGDLRAAELDLRKSKDFGQVEKSKRDRGAKKRLDTYWNLLVASQKSEAEINTVEVTFNDAVNLFNQKNLEAAQKQFEAVLKQDPNHSGAPIYLQKIEDALARVADLKTEQNQTPKKEARTKKASEQVARLEPPTSRVPGRSEKRSGTKGSASSFQQALAFFEAGDLKGAKSKFQQVDKTAANRQSAIDYLQKIDEAEKQAREGVISFFEGNTAQSIKLLNQALRVYQTNPDVQAFLGSAHATAYFLSGEEDKESLQKATAEFDKIKKLDSGYRLDSRYFSPRIIDLFVHTPQN